MTAITSSDPCEILKCWEEHFSIHLNTSFQHQQSVIYEILDPTEDADNLSPISEDEIEQATGIDITAEVLRTGGKQMPLLLHKKNIK